MKRISVKLKSMIKFFLYLFSKKRVKLENNSIGKISVSKKDLSVFSLSTNPIISFKIDGELFFFRECHKIYKKREFYENSIIRFFDFIELQKVDKEIFKEKIPIRVSFLDEEINGFKKYILNQKNERLFYQKIVKTDKISDRIGFNIWKTQIYNDAFFTQFGMGDLPSEYFDIAVLFLWHMRSSFLNYRTRKISVWNGYSFFSAGKAIASKIVAEELGVAHMIVDAKPVYLSLSGNVQLFGVLTPKAQGYRARDLQISASSSLQKELHDLYLLDKICFQTDHGPDNYNIYGDDQMYYVTAFDNDNQYTFSPITNIKAGIGGKGCILFPIISSDIFEGIKKVNFDILRERLMPYLNRIQIYALIYRIKGVQRAMLRSQEKGELTILKNNDWSEYVIQRELNGEFGETYLTNLMKVIDK